MGTRTTAFSARPDQTEGSQCLGLGAATLPTTTQPRHSLTLMLTLPSHGAMDTTPTYWDDAKTLLNRRPTQLTAACTNPIFMCTYPHIYPDTQRQRHANIGIHSDGCMHTCRHAHTQKGNVRAGRTMKGPNVTVDDRLPRARHWAGHHTHVTSPDPPDIYLQPWGQAVL